VPLAAVLDHPDHFADRTVGLIISGGNADLDHLPW
jgi:threonine dehydratase